MDTRKKIRTWEELRRELADGGWKILAGVFDPLTPETAQRIESVAESGRKLLVVIRSGNDSLFDASSRAQLVAGLRVVDAVMVETSSDWRVIAGANAEAMVKDDSDDCPRRRRQFEERVATRQKLASGA